MHFHFSFYSSLLLILFSQGILFSVLLVWRGVRHADKPSLWLSLFIFLCSFFLLPWMLGHAGWYSLQPYRDILFYIPTQQQFLIGPVIYCYTQSLLNPSASVAKTNRLHFILAVLYMVYSLVVFITDKLVFQQYYFYANGRDKDLDSWYQIAGLVSMIIYGLLSLRYYFLYKKIIYQATSFANSVLFDWVKKYLLAFFIMQLAMLGLWIFFPQWGSFTQKWWYYFFFGCTVYYIALSAYSNKIKAAVAFRSMGWRNEEIFLLPSSSEFIEEADIEQFPQQQLLLSPSFAAEDQANVGEISQWKEKISALLKNEKLYQDPELTLAILAAKAGTNIAIISRAINSGFSQNFNDYINGYRVEALKEFFAKGEHKRQTLLSLAFECGFNSKTTFNRSFKKVTGLSPKQYLAMLENTVAVNNTNQSVVTPSK